ncbi:MAG TPA: FliM/FliN family flagellar motor switch protein [Longimicrobiales bacterium]|jgi:flagellar motor switch protein FliM
MASETLSQREIDLLFGRAAAAEAEPKLPARDTRREVQVYDFRRPNRISKERLRTLQAMYGLLVKSLESWLTARVRGEVDLQLLGVEQFSFGEFVLSLRVPCASYVFDIADSGGQQGVIDFGPELAFYLIDRLLGGSGPPIVLQRALTPLERMVVQLVADYVAGQLTEIWRDHVRLDLTLNRFESIPDMLQIANDEDPVLVANVGFRAEGIESVLLLCLPFAVLEKFFTGGGGRRVQAGRVSPQDREADREAVERAVRATHVPISVRLPEFRLSMRELEAFRPGKVVATGLPPGGEVEVLVAGRRRYRATVGRIGRRLAVRIVEPIRPEGEPPVSAAERGSTAGG